MVVRHLRRVFAALTSLLLVVFWVGGFALNLAGGIIHLLLVMAVILALYNLFVARRRSV